MSRARSWFAIGGIAMIIAIAGAWLLLWRVPVRDARSLLSLLPPDADAYAVVDLDRLQSNPVLKKLLADPPAPLLSPDYEEFIRQSGFRYQSDLQRLAVARIGSEWIGTAVVRLNHEQWSRYAELQNAVKSQIAGSDIYAFGNERPLRLAVLSNDLVAFSVGESESGLREVIEGFSGRPARQLPDVLVQDGLLEGGLDGDGLWLAARTERLLGSDEAGVELGSFRLGQDWLQGSRWMVANVVSSPLRLDIHIESLCQTEAAAGRMANAFKTLLALLKPPPGQGSEGSKYAPLLQAIRIQQRGKSVTLDWQWDPSMLALLLEEPPGE